MYSVQIRALSVSRLYILIQIIPAGNKFYEIAIVEGVYQNAKAKRSWKWGDLSVFFAVSLYNFFLQNGDSLNQTLNITIVKYFSLQLSMRGNSFHQQLAKRTSSTVVTSDWFVVWYLGLWNRCRLIHGSSSGNPGDPRRERTRSRLTWALSKKWYIHLVIHGQRDLTQAQLKWLDWPFTYSIVIGDLR